MENSPLQQAHGHWQKCRSSCVLASHPAAPTNLSCATTWTHFSPWHFLPSTSFILSCMSLYLASNFFLSCFYNCLPSSFLAYDMPSQTFYALPWGLHWCYISFSMHMLCVLIAIISVLLSSFYHRCLIHLMTYLNESFIPAWTKSLSRGAHQVSSCLIAFLPVL